MGYDLDTSESLSFSLFCIASKNSLFLFAKVYIFHKKVYGFQEIHRKFHCMKLEKLEKL